MLMGDPRRANWLELSAKMCWPQEEERPNWELEAEVLRLTTRLMLRERQLRAAQAATVAAQETAEAWRRKAQARDTQVGALLECETRGLSTQLLLLEAGLRREQSRVEQLLEEKEDQIEAQARQIEALKRQLAAGEKRRKVRDLKSKRITSTHLQRDC